MIKAMYNALGPSILTGVLLYLIFCFIVVVFTLDFKNNPFKSTAQNTRIPSKMDKLNVKPTAQN